MNRRTFMQSMAAAFAASGLGATFSPSVPKVRYDLFTSASSMRYSIGEPFTIGETVYATDCRIIIAHASDGVLGRQDRRIPRADSLNWDEFNSTGWNSLGMPRYLKRSGDGHFCPRCCGTGRIGSEVRRCIHCGGSGEWVGLDNKIHDGCERCHEGWMGGMKCDCDGGWNEHDLREQLGGYGFSPGMMSRVRTLGDLDVKVIESPAYKHWGRSGVLLFRNDFIRGMLMGMTDE